MISVGSLFCSVKVPSLSVMQMNQMSLLRLYERIKTAVTAPIKIASFFPGRRLTAVRSEITSVVGVS